MSTRKPRTVTVTLTLAEAEGLIHSEMLTESYEDEHWDFRGDPRRAARLQGGACDGAQKLRRAIDAGANRAQPKPR